MLCPQCQTQNPEAAHFCLNCGKELLHLCENCHTELAQDARFCMYCGHPVQASSPDDDVRLSRLAASAPEPLANKVRAAAEIAGERRVVTVLFIDVVGSTALAEQLDVEAWSRIMNDAFERITPVIYHYEGTIARLMGDALVAFFGAPVAHEDDPIRAVRAALDVLESASSYAQEIRQEYSIDFAMRATISRGPVVIEKVNRDLKYDYIPLGGVINLAARIKFAAEPMTALISEDVYRFVEPLFDFQDLGLIEVRNREQPERVYKVLGEKVTPGTLRGIAGLESPLVGRDDEINRLMGLCSAVQAGLGRAVLITGEPGLGKSRLVMEWQAEVANSHTDFIPQWAEGHCLSYGAGLAYHLLTDLLRSLLGLSDVTDEPSTNEALQDILCDLYDKERGTPPLDVYPYLAHLLSLRLEGESLEQIQRTDPQALQVHYRIAFQKLLEILTSHRSLVLVLEDLHWADPSSVEVLSHLLQMARTHSLLFCLVTRPEREVPGWKLAQAAREILGGSLTEISLGALSESDSRVLVSNLLEIEALDEEMRSLILRRAEGNPFFVEEVIRMLIEQRAIMPVGGGWKASARISDVQIPDNLQGLLMARIDRLPEEERHALRVASVVGRQFPVKVLDYVLSNGGGSRSQSRDTRQKLGDLEVSGLVTVARVEPDLEYLFRHSMIQDAAYESLLLTDREKLHLAVGEAVEILYPDRLEEFAAMLARHFGAAGAKEQSEKYCILAGDAALAAFATQEAEGHYRCALGYSKTELVRADLLTKLGEALFAQSRFQQAIDVWKEGIEVYRGLRNYEGMANLYTRCARGEWHSDNTPESLNRSLEGIANVPDELDGPDMARLLHEVGRSYYFNGQPEEAASYCERALEMAESHSAVDVQADTMATLGVVYGDDPVKANYYLEKAVDLAEEHGFLTIAARAHHNLSSNIIGLHDDYEAGRTHLLRAAEIHRSRGNIQSEIFSLINAIGMSFQLGNLAKMEEMQAYVKSLLKSLPDPESLEIEVAVTDAILLGFSGKWEQAIEMLRKYQVLARQRGNLQMISGINNILVFLILEIDQFMAPQDIGEAEQASLEILSLAERGLSDRVQARCQHGIVMIRKGDIQAAHQYSNEAEDLANQSLSVDRRSLLDMKGELAVAEGRWDDAIGYIGDLVDEERRLGQRWICAHNTIKLADAYISRGQAQDFGRAQEAYRSAYEAFQDMGVSLYMEIIERRQESLQDKTLTTILASRKVAQELTHAGKIQSSFLPEQIPEIEGWSLSAVLEPARETSGDYYDFISLPDNRLGILIADVTDKGAGAALFMASSRTLVRTFAQQYPDQPDQVIKLTNDRLVVDTHGGLFVTIFYGILDPQTGMLTYCNAGHNPPYLFKAGSGGDVVELLPTGMTIGIFEEESWERGTVQLEDNDLLVMYTDGVPDAEDEAGKFYEEKRLIQAVKSGIAGGAASAETIQEVLLKDIHQFVGAADRSDDITLVILSKTAA